MAFKDRLVLHDQDASLTVEFNDAFWTFSINQKRAVRLEDGSKAYFDASIVLTNRQRVRLRKFLENGG